MSEHAKIEAPPTSGAARSNLSRAAFALLVLMGLLALAASGRAVSNYVSALASVRSLELEIVGVHNAGVYNAGVHNAGTDNADADIAGADNAGADMADADMADADNAQLLLEFRLHNPSSLPIRLNSYFFELYLDGERIGGSNSAYLGERFDIDHSQYSRAATIDRVLAPQTSLDLDFPLYVFDLDRLLLVRPNPSKPPDWSVHAGFRLVHPHGRDERLLRLQAVLQEPQQ